MQKRIGWLVLGVLAMGAGCGAVDQLSNVEQNAIGPATVTTDNTSYQFNDNVLVSWSGLNGNANDYVAIAPDGSPLTTITRWVYTGGAASGSHLLEGPAAGGSYVARAFDNDSYTLMGESDAFTVADPGSGTANITLDQPDYAIDQNIVVSFTGMPGSAKDWIAISPEGANDMTQAMWKYTGGGAAGSVTFNLGLGPSGKKGGTNYVARAYLNDSYVRVDETAAVLIGAMVTTSASTYTTDQAITVSWTHLPGGSGDWIALAPPAAAPASPTTWIFTGGAANGSVTFTDGLPSTGTFVARAMSPNYYFVAGESAPFTITQGAQVVVTTDMTSYAAGQDITVTWQGTPGNANDWIAIAPNGSASTSVTRWVYTGGQANGSYTFEGVAAGTYVARAFLNDRYVKIGESASFPVN